MIVSMAAIVKINDKENPEQSFKATDEDHVVWSGDQESNLD